MGEDATQRDRHTQTDSERTVGGGDVTRCSGRLSELHRGWTLSSHSQAWLAGIDLHTYQSTTATTTHTHANQPTNQAPARQPTTHPSTRTHARWHLPCNPHFTHHSHSLSPTHIPTTRGTAANFPSFFSVIFILQISFPDVVYSP